MRCETCGGVLEALETDLPFKVSQTTIVILKGLPVLQCENCSQFVIEDAVMHRVDQILETVDSAAELEIVRYAA